MNDLVRVDFDELDELSSGWIDGLLADAEVERLQEILKQSAAHRSRFLHLVHTDTLAAQALKSEVLLAEPLIPVDSILVEQKKKSVRVAILSAAAVILLGIMVMSFFLTPQREQGQLTFQTSQGTQYTLTHDSTHDQLPTGQMLIEGSRLQLSQGTVELTFPSGVKSLVMAPADITLRKHDLLTLDRGAAWFHVPEEAVGFAVQTKYLDVVDLGTKFGVSSQPGDALDQVHVFQGRVKVTARQGRKEETILEANQARELDPTGRLKEVDCVPSQFLTTLPDTLPYLHWSFDALDGDALAVDGTHPDTHGLATTLKSVEAGAKLVPGRLGSALSLDGQGSYVMTDWPGFGGGHARTVSFWLKLPNEPLPAKTAGIIGWGDNSQKGAKWAVAVRRAKKDKSGTKAELSLALGRKMIVVERHLELDRWYHVAVTYSGVPDFQGQYIAQTYIDGKRAELRATRYQVNEPLRTSTLSRHAQPLCMGVRIRSDKQAAERRYFKGMLDELYIFDGYMSQNEIKRLANP